MPTWDDRQPIYRQLADRLAGALLDGDPPEGEPMPSVRALAAQYMLNPLTVGRALQALADDGLLDNRRGIGLYVKTGARDHLRALERQRFLEQEWPQLRTRLRRLGLQIDQLRLDDDKTHSAGGAAR
jgi:GntR family transcriptional regulator